MPDRLLRLPLSKRVRAVLQEVPLADVSGYAVDHLRQLRLALGQLQEDVPTEVRPEEVGLDGPAELERLLGDRAEEYLSSP